MTGHARNEIDLWWNGTEQLRAEVHWWSPPTCGSNSCKKVATIFPVVWDEVRAWNWYFWDYKDSDEGLQWQNQVKHLGAYSFVLGPIHHGIEMYGFPVWRHNDIPTQEIVNGACAHVEISEGEEQAYAADYIAASTQGYPDTERCEDTY